MAPALLLALLIAAAPPRSPPEQAQLTALAQALGSAHALHRLCAPDDEAAGPWRSRMGRILELEQPPPALRQRLVDAFNAGFESGRAAYPACSEDSRAAAAAAARSAAAAARNLSDHAAEL